MHPITRFIADVINFITNSMNNVIAFLTYLTENNLQWIWFVGAAIFGIIIGCIADFVKNKVKKY